MQLKFKIFLIFISLNIQSNVFSQNVVLKEVFNGQFDFTFIGNTLNPDEDSFMVIPEIFTQSSATLNLQNNDVIEKAFLYWSGCGPGDFNVKLNGVTIDSQRSFGLNLPNSTLPFFGAFADVTNQVKSTGNGVYELSDLNLTNEIANYFPNQTNYGGWAIVIIYSNVSLPINQINVYDGFKDIPRTAGTSLNISLNSLNVIDNLGAKIGFIAWEGDQNIAVNETLNINGNTLSNAPLNPADNAFNSTNSVTNSSDLYNMDLDIYDIQNNINVGDTSAQIDLTSGQDFVIINTIVTKLNSQLPDASITIDNVAQTCNSNVITVTYTVYNTNSSAELPTNTLINYTVGWGEDDQIMFQNYPLVYTTSAITINGQTTYQVIITLPNKVVDAYWLDFCVNINPNTGQTYTPEINTLNNCYHLDLKKFPNPKFNFLSDLESCNNGLTSGFFDFSSYENLVKKVASDIVSFFESEIDAINNQNKIIDTSNYYSIVTPKKIFVKLVNSINCYSITSFNLKTKKCEPIIYNAVSANNDNKNDVFFIKGLRDVFLDFELLIYNRWGQLVWNGNNNIPDFSGISNVGLHLDDKNLPDGTYFYILNLNDIDYPKPKNGYLYLTK
jgi:CHU_C Type IX secretion signal domain